LLAISQVVQACLCFTKFRSWLAETRFDDCMVGRQFELYCVHHPVIGLELTPACMRFLRQSRGFSDQCLGLVSAGDKSVLPTRLCIQNPVPGDQGGFDDWPSGRPWSRRSAVLAEFERSMTQERVLAGPTGAKAGGDPAVEVNQGLGQREGRLRRTKTGARKRQSHVFSYARHVSNEDGRVKLWLAHSFLSGMRR
jgi:hypothetical protein